MKIYAEECVNYLKPTILIGVSAQKDSFTKSIVETMCKTTENPLIFPLSNPTSLCEILPKNAIEWSDGKALVATGSPFADVKFKGKSHVIS